MPLVASVQMRAFKSDFLLRNENLGAGDIFRRKLYNKEKGIQLVRSEFYPAIFKEAT